MTISGLHPTQLKARPPICKKQTVLAYRSAACRPSLSCLVSLSGLLALALSLSLSTTALATKLNAAPLPHAGAASGATGVSGDVNEYGRPIKDFSHGQESAPPSTQWQTHRLTPAEKAAKDKEEAAAKAKAQADAVKKAQDDRVNAIRTYQQISIDANNKAILLGKQGKLTEAIAEHELSLKYDPNNQQFRINLSAAQTLYGQKLLAQKDFAGAANMFRKALGAKADNGQAGKYLKEAIQRMGMDPNLSDNRIGIGDQLAAAGDTTGAMIEYQQAMLLDPSARTYTKMGDMYLQYGPSQANRAVTFYHQAIVKDADYGPAHRSLGNIMLLMKDTTTAASELRKAVILDPKDTAAGQSLIDIWRRQVATNPNLAENHLGLATAMQLTGDLSTAESEYNQVERLDPRNASLAAGRASLQRAYKHLEAEKHYAASQTFLNQGLGRDAMAEIGQAVMNEPRNPRYQFVLGQCLESNGDLENAKQAFHTVVLIDPKNTEAAQHLREVENTLAGSGRGQASQPPVPRQPISLTRPDSAGSQAAQQNPGMGIGSSQGPAQGSAQGSAQRYGQGSGQGSGQASFGRNGGESGRDKNMFEGNPQTAGGRPPNQGDYPGRGQGTAPQYNNNQASRYPNQQNSGQPAPTANRSQAQAPATAQTIDPQTQATLTAASNMENQRDYQGAANLLKQSLNGNLQNPEIHHRLAVNLLNLGQLEEAVSEFRIASALNPGSKMFMEDYARALKIHKKALQSDDSQSYGGGQATGAVGDLK
jgi:tetratricopeptide (TPR) repeat protein